MKQLSIILTFILFNAGALSTEELKLPQAKGRVFDQMNNNPFPHNMRPRSGNISKGLETSKRSEMSDKAKLALYSAYGNVEKVDELLKKVKPDDSYFPTCGRKGGALQQAVGTGNILITKLLVQHKATISERLGSFYSDPDQCQRVAGVSSLHWARGKNYKEMVDILEQGIGFKGRVSYITNPNSYLQFENYSGSKNNRMVSLGWVHDLPQNRYHNHYLCRVNKTSSYYGDYTSYGRLIKNPENGRIECDIRTDNDSNYRFESKFQVLYAKSKLPDNYYISWVSAVSDAKEGDYLRARAFKTEKKGKPAYLRMQEYYFFTSTSNTPGFYEFTDHTEEEIKKDNWLRKYLLIARADGRETRYTREYRMNTRLTQAVYDNNISQIKQMLREGANVNHTHSGYSMLMITAYKGFYNAAKTLLEAGADRDYQHEGYDASYLAYMYNHTDIRKLLEEGRHSMSRSRSQVTPRSIMLPERPQ